MSPISMFSAAACIRAQLLRSSNERPYRYVRTYQSALRRLEWLSWYLIITPSEREQLRCGALEQLTEPPAGLSLSFIIHFCLSRLLDQFSQFLIYLLIHLGNKYRANCANHPGKCEKNHGTHFTCFLLKGTQRPMSGEVQRNRVQVLDVTTLRRKKRTSSLLLYAFFRRCQLTLFH